MARCAAHEDRKASLSVTRGTDRVLLKCHAGCDIDDIVSAVGLSRADLFDEPKQHADGDDWVPCGHGIAAEYRYVDEAEELLFTVVRCPKKDFAQWRPDPAAKTGRRWKLGDVRRVLYRLPQIIDAVQQGTPVWVVEGEKDADRLIAAGVVATCNPHGAGKWRDEYAATLAGADVTVVADRDDKGREHAATVAANLQTAGCTVRVVEAAAGKDVSDHLNAGHTLDQLLVVEDETRPQRPQLEVITVKELRARVDAAGPRKWLLRGIWPGGAYGIHAGEMKAQKTWNGVDLAVSVASGTPWLGAVAVDDAGPVLVFAGEGGEANLLRRIDAVAQTLPVDDLPINICTRVPHLSNLDHLRILSDELGRIEPRLVVLDPLYLAARGAKGSDLYAMGELLETVQHLCTKADSSLWIATHLNRKEGRGAGRITGAGPAEWGRVLVTATVISRHTDPTSKETTVITELDVIGGEVADRTLRVTRRIRALEPDNLDSPLIYRVDALEAEDVGEGLEKNMPPARAKLLAAVRAIADGIPRTWRELAEHIGHTHGHYLKRETCSRELTALAEDGYIDRLDQGKGRQALWLTKTDADPQLDL